MTIFSWKPIYRELAEKLLAYRNRQPELLGWLREIDRGGTRNLFSLPEDNLLGTKTQLTGIDPFTIFVMFNRNIGDTQRKEVLAELKQRFQLTSEIPTDFCGLTPINMQSWPYAYAREPGEIKNLWDFAEQVVHRQPRDIDPKFFSLCTGSGMERLHNITWVLYWMQPDRYVASASFRQRQPHQPELDFTVRPLVEWSDYLQAVDACLKEIDPDPAQVALIANTGSWDIRALVTMEEVDRGFANLLQRTAANQRCSVGELAKWLYHEGGRDPKTGKSEVTHRLNAYPELAELLQKTDGTLEELPLACRKLWVLSQQQDSMRWPKFLKHPEALNLIRSLLAAPKDLSVIPLLRDFIKKAHAYGYAPSNDKTDLTLPAQFASVLLTACHPERFVDYKQSRWNVFFKSVTNLQAPLCPDPAASASNLLRAGSFAALLGKTPTFKQYFSPGNTAWIASGLAILWKDGTSGDWHIQSDTQSAQGSAQDVLNEREKTMSEISNIILCGPPGTGKTYISLQRAVELATQASFEERAKIVGRLEELRGDQRVQFVTFHQSYSYEDFVEGIRPELDADGDRVRYECRDGVFKELALLALYDCLEPKQAVEANVFETRWMALIQHIQASPDLEYDTVSKQSTYRLHVSSRGNITSSKVGDPAASSLVFSRSNMRKVYAAHGDKPEITTTAIADTLGVGSHSSLGALLFRELKRISPTATSLAPAPMLSAEDRCEIARLFLQEGDAGPYRLRSSGPRCHYVLVVDEINRGNISKIFGELITLIEPDKRIGAENAMRIVLPYSKDVFGVPPNLHLVGSMNTADKSIALVDVALRRRFEFEELMPDFDDKEKCPGLTPVMRNVLNELNRRITLRKDRDHQIGHAYFRNVGDDDQFNRIFVGRIIPLLQEYFYNDWEGLRYVLGESGTSGNFIRPIQIRPNEPKSRHAWQWCFDAGAKRADVKPLPWLVSQYDLASKD